MKKLLSVILSLTILLITLPIANLTVFAATNGTTGDCTYSLNGTVLTISGNGAMGDYDFYEGGPWGTNITEVIFEEGVTQIGAYAFKSCESLTKVNIASTVKTINEYAFSWCSALESIKIVGGVKTIGNNAFYCCEGLKTVEIQDGVNTISDSAFYDCSSLTNLTIPNSVTIIEGYAFYGCSSLTSVVIPSSITEISFGVFYGCSHLEEITIPSSVTKIGSYAFQYCHYLDTVYYMGTETQKTAITIDKNNTNFENSTWYYNSCIQSAQHTYSNNCSDKFCDVCNFTRTPPHNFASECDTACDDCGLERETTAEHTYTDEQDEICDNCGFSRRETGAAGNCTYSLNGTVLTISGTGPMSSFSETGAPWGNGITAVIIEDGISSISSNAFKGCTSLESITLPKSVTAIDIRTFNDCSSLSTVYYMGSEAHKLEIFIDEYNQALVNANWHYNSCIQSAQHTYENEQDTTCDICAHIRTIETNIGDIDGKNGINNSDLIMLRRFLAGWGVEINEEAANLDGKGGVNNSDAIWLARHLAGWDGYELN